MTRSNVIPLPVRPARIIHRHRATTTQAPARAVCTPASHLLPAGGEARPDASHAGRAVIDFVRHRPLCATCTCSPCACQRGTLGGAWIADQIAHATPADTGFDAAAYRAAMQRPARLADLRSPAGIFRLADLTCHAWVLIWLAALLVANLHRLL